jgi:hypothetical protein
MEEQLEGQFIEPTITVEFNGTRLQKFIPANDKYDSCDYCGLSETDDDTCRFNCCSSVIWRKAP